jgi:hypothetical protein
MGRGADPLAWVADLEIMHTGDLVVAGGIPPAVEVVDRGGQRARPARCALPFPMPVPIARFLTRHAELVSVVCLELDP